MSALAWRDRAGVSDDVRKTPGWDEQQAFVREMDALPLADPQQLHAPADKRF